MRVAFVGVKRKYQELDPSYRWNFTRFHIEFPWYFARSGLEIALTTVDFEDSCVVGDGSLAHVLETKFDRKVDAVVHWRKWHRDLAVPGVPNFVHLCDFNYGADEVEQMRLAAEQPWFAGALAFRAWHAEQVVREMPCLAGKLHLDVALGVDPEIYRPEEKDRFKMLWASDPGRGLEGAVKLAADLWKRDRRYKLHVCYPDYVKSPITLSLPWIEGHRNLKNGPELWSLFNTSTFLPYTSTFPEPSSRVHRQGQSAGCVVLYPPAMGSPSSFIEDGKTGYVRDTSTWADLIHGMDEATIQSVSRQARELAASEDWSYRAEQFKALLRG